MLELKELRKTFRSRDNIVQALKGVSLSVKQGEIVALLGSNGAGKTTTMRVIAGLILPDEGTVTIEGKPPNSPAYKNNLGALLDTARSSTARLGVLENLEYSAALRGLDPKTAKARALQLTLELGLVDKRNASTQTLSKGMLSKLALASALIHEPKCMLLDEPTLGLDLEAGDALEARIKDMAKNGAAVLLSTHQMEVAQRVAQRVVIISQGQVVLDKPKSELVSQFGAQTYSIQFFETPESIQIPFPYTLQNSQLTVTLPDSMAIYELMRLLYPQKIISIERIETDLGTIFRKVIGEVLV
jgi:ABC-2 type transport system ATP-binding protein